MSFANHVGQLLDQPGDPTGRLVQLLLPALFALRTPRGLGELAPSLCLAFAGRRQLGLELGDPAPRGLWKVAGDTLCRGNGIRRALGDRPRRPFLVGHYAVLD
jgi:hypothetical protein